MKKNEQISTLTTQEFHLICDGQNGLVKNPQQANFKEVFIESIYESMEHYKLDVKYQVNKDELTEKLCNMTYEELLHILNEVDVFWDRQENYYSVFKLVSPASIINRLI